MKRRWREYFDDLLNFRYNREAVWIERRRVVNDIIEEAVLKTEEIKKGNTYWFRRDFLFGS